VHRTEVLAQLEQVFRSVRESIASFDDSPGDSNYDESAFRLALWAHAEVVRVHPFEDGNGRSARALMNWILVRLGLRPIDIRVPKQEYHSCLNHYYRTNDLSPLLDLALSLYPVG
jgi:Fic family protein